MTWDADLISDLPVEDPLALEAVLVRERSVLDGLGTTQSGEADRARALALWRMGDALFRLRRMTEAVLRLEEAERAFERVPDCELSAAGARLVRAGALVALERYEEGAKLALDVQAYGRSVENPQLIRSGGFAAAIGFKGAGRWQDAAASATAYLADVVSDQSPKDLPRVATALVIRAAGERLQGRPEKALGLLDQAIPILTKGQDREELYQAMDERAASLYSAGRPGEARAAYAEIIGEFRDSSEEFRTTAVWGSRAWKLRIRVRPNSPPRPPT